MNIRVKYLTDLKTITDLKMANKNLKPSKLEPTSTGIIIKRIGK